MALQIKSLVSFSVEASLEQYCIFGDFVLADLSEFLQAKQYDDVVFTVNGVQYNLIVENKLRARKPANNQYILECASKLIMLDVPHSAPITKEFEASSAKRIVEELIAPYGIALQWDILDWNIKAETLFANEDSRINVIRNIVNSVGAKVQSTPGGKMVIKYKYAVDTDKYNTANLSTSLTDSADTFQVSENVIEKPGYNKYLVSDEASVESAAYLEQEDVENDPDSKIIKGYIVPWHDQNAATLETSGGHTVRISYEGVKTEQIEEQVEIFKGAGNVSKPVYGPIEVTPLYDDVGQIYAAEDGSLTASVDDETLIKIVYTTKYHKWTVFNSKDEDTQFILEVDYHDN